MISAYRPEPIQRVVAREGYPFILFLIVMGAIFGIMGWAIATFCCFALAAFVMFFFRNPERPIPQSKDLILAPADGRIVAVEKVEKAPNGEGQATKVSIFMSVLNVHINRMPITAKIKDVKYYSGKFLVASLDKASDHNERNELHLEDEEGRCLTMTQIAGLVARRIVCYVKPGDMRSAGDRFGLIRFGSRVDIYLKDPHSIEVSVGEKVKGGSSILGRWT
jgi:phosphatidylserine decarboxylase